MLRFRIHFNNAVARLREDYREKTRDITFADMATQEGYGAAWRWFERASTPFLDFTLQGRRFESGVRYELGRAAEAFALRDPVGGRMLLAARSAYGFQAFHPHPMNDAFIIFYHEAGHLIPGGGLPLWRERLDSRATQQDQFVQEHPCETTADVFAAASGLRLNFMKAADVARMSLHRAVDAWITGDVSYATSPALDRLAEPAEARRVAGFSPAQAQLYAETAAPRHCFPEQELRAAIKGFSLMKGGNRLDTPPQKETIYARQEWLSHLALVFLEAGKGSVERHLSTKILGHVLKTGRLDHPAPRIFDTKGSVYETVRKEMARRRMGGET